MRLIDRIISLLGKYGGLTDKEIADKLGLPRRQSVNKAARSAASEGSIRREKTGDGIIRNFLTMALRKVRTRTRREERDPGRGTQTTRRMREARDSPKGQLFRDRVILLLEEADTEVAAAVRRDLSRMIKQPFYGEKVTKFAHSRSTLEMLIAYAHLLQTTQDSSFRRDFIREISAHQNCLLRSYAERVGPKAGGGQVMEHVIPTKFIADEMLRLIEENDLRCLPLLLGLYRKAGQRALAKTADALLNKAGLKHQMPADWDWREEDADHLARYRAVGILDRVFLQPHES